MHQVAARGKAHRLRVGIKWRRDRLGDRYDRMVQRRLGRRTGCWAEFDDLGAYAKPFLGNCQNIFQLLDRRLAVVAWNKPPINHQIAGFRYDRVTGPRQCTCHGQAWRSDQGMMLVAELVVVMLIEESDQFSRLDDGVDAQMRRAGMRSHTMDSDD